MPVILLHGDNTLEIDEAARTLRGRFNAVDTIQYEGATAALGEISGAVGTVGLFDPERLVIVRGLQDRLKGAKKDGESVEVRRTLGSVAPSTTLLLLSPGMDEKGQLIDLVREVSGEVRSFTMPRKGDVPRWIASRGPAHGVQVRRDAAELLAEMLPPDPMLLDTEIEKLAVYTGDGGIVTPTTVETLVGAVSQDSIFGLVDAIAAGDAAQALRLLQGQVEHSSTTATDFALYLIRMLARQMRILLKIRLYQEAGRSSSQITSDLKLNRYFADRYFRQARRLSRTRLIATFERLATLEHGLKSGRADAVPGLDLLISDLCA